MHASPCQCSFTAALLLLGGTPVFIASAGDYNHTVIARTGLSGLTAMSAPSINDLGRVAFVGTVADGQNLFVGRYASGPRSINPSWTSQAFPAGGGFTLARINNLQQVLAVDGNCDATGACGWAVRIWNADTPDTSTILGASRDVSLDRRYFRIIELPPALNNLGQAVFVAEARDTNGLYAGRVLVSLGSIGLRQIPLDQLGDAGEYPRMADDGHILIRTGGAASGDISWIDKDLGSRAIVASVSPATDFAKLGAKPGMSPDGQVVVWSGELTDTGAKAINSLRAGLTYPDGNQPALTPHQPGPGIFARVNTPAPGQWISVRLAGVAGNGILDPGETYVDANHNGQFDPGELDLGLFSGFEPDSFVCVNGTASIQQGVTVAFIAYADKPITGLKGLYSVRLDFPGTTVSNEPMAFRVGPAKLVVEVGETIEGLDGTVKDIGVFEAVNNVGPGDIAFWVQMTSNQQAVVRARLKPGAEVLALEVTQTVQDWHNSVPLIEGKATLVRAFLRATDLDNVPLKIDARLRGFQGADELPGSPQVAMNASSYLLPRPGANLHREDLDDSLNFTLPPTWLKGDVTLRLVWEKGSLACPLPSPAAPDTTGCQVEVSFQPVPIPKVRFYRVELVKANGATFQPSEEDVSELAAELRAIYPIRGLILNRSETLWGPEDADPVDLQPLNEKLNLLHRWRDVWFPDDVNELYYAVVLDPTVPHNTTNDLGLALDVPHRIASGLLSTNLDDFWRNTHAHELAHCLGLRHTVTLSLGIDANGRLQGYCGETASTNATNFPFFAMIDGSQHYTLGPMDGPDTDQMFGYDSHLGLALSPTEHFELMSYCGGEFDSFWISSFTYTNLIDPINRRFGSVPFRVLAARPTLVSQKYLLVRGVIDLPTGTASFLPFVEVETAETPPSLTPGPYTLDALDGQGSQLAEVAFQPSVGEPRPAGPPATQATFLVPILAQASIRKVVLAHAGVELATRIATVHPPTVSVTYPQGGETFTTNSFVFQWAASDADGDNLSYAVQFSTDAGASWEPLDVDLSDRSFAIDPRSLRATSLGKLRVVATDGFNTAAAESPGVFTVPNHSPHAAIYSPGDGSLFVGHQQMLMQGGAWDVEQGELSGSNIVWTSSLDGVLGGGDLLVADAGALSEGDHVLMMTATDSNGLQAVKTVGVRVMRAVPADNADLAIRVDAAPQRVGPGEQVTFMFTIANAGPAPATGVVFQDALPAGLVLLSTTATQGTFQNTPGMVTCHIGPLDPEATATVTLLCLAAAEGTAVQTASVKGNEPDVIAANNVRRRSIQIAPPQAPTLAIRPSEAGSFLIRLNGDDQGFYRLDSSTNLLDWKPVLANSPTNGVMDYWDSASTNSAQRFYRGVLVP